ncbi:hypothetical protein TWF506_002704 [Arthrobotrys conoides]|uniref:Uncharacterized protein n=1 Tax=Arthrobotrys conoides TaxID=74498 RepID=A0AAN8NPE4_9PEZI
MIVPYIAICFLTLAFRFSFFENGVCRIGMKKIALLPLITFDVVVNVYLTTLFLIPVVKIAHGKAQQSHRALRSMAIKTFCGSCATLISSVAYVELDNAYVVERGTGMVLFSVVVLHTITNKDHQGSSDTTRATNSYASQHDTTIIGNATDPGTRRSSIAQGHKPSMAADTGIIGPRLSPTFENDRSDPSSEKSVSTSELTAERKGSEAWLFTRNNRNTSTVTELQFDIDPTDQGQSHRARPGVPRRVSMAVNVRPIADYADYDSDGLDFVTSQQIAEDLSSNGEGEQHALSDEEIAMRREKYEERVPHRLV